MRAALRILGYLLIAAGALFALQGSGLVMWPASSFMLMQRDWITYGIAIALAGVAIVAVARRRRS